ncbi:NAD(P)H-binding protein [Amycolatopsis sp. SID8362]|uniref:NAD(P)H-binding protein n=1 Tax=Amycolatopsis sp. SID8362 TaxID=2690346 RepID=UPI0013701485|nr:NAD(P)H-binding protein [Amycolatopsis sp. SID8362]NBH07516.1 NAD(P)H-binding protein [Amycolatopsis sp. SID8362]NED44212.1 NAD(P)H-binding protein [Amycolatopsis sp. SID8362]
MIVLTGATGLVGRLLTAELAGRARIVTRTPPAEALPAEVFEGDPSRPETLTDALRGASTLFLHPRAVGDAAYELVALARDLGVRRVVALAAANVDDDLAAQPSRFRGDRNKEADDAAATSGLEWVSVRPSSFALNALTAWAGQIRAGDDVRYVHAGFEESPLHERDLVEVLVRALVDDDLLGRRIDLTGPESLSHAEMVARIGTALGRPLRFHEVPAEAAARGMIASGLPEPFVTAMMARYAAHLAKPQFPPNAEVEKILGRPALTFAEWAAEHAADFRPAG